MRRVLAAILGLLLASGSAFGQVTWPYPSPGVARIVGQLRGANFNVTTDQPIAILNSVQAFEITSIIVTNCSVSMTTAVGGFYTAASKGGTAIVLASQVYSALTTTAALLRTTIDTVPAATRYAQSTVWLSLTTAQGAAATCDVYVMGIDLT